MLLLPNECGKAEKEEKEVNEQTLLQQQEQQLTPEQLQIRQLEAIVAQVQAEMAETKAEAAEAKVEAAKALELEKQKQKQKRIQTFIIEDNESTVYADNDEQDDILQPILLCKPCQSGKTGEAFHDWVKEQDPKDEASSTEMRKIAFFVCDNSLLLTKQTEIRAKSDDIQITGDIISISCKANIKCAAKLFNAITDNLHISTILCCGNTKRLKDISELSARLKRWDDGKFELSIYIDEADRILGSTKAKEQVAIWRQPTSLVKKLVLVTATPYESARKNLANDFGDLLLLPVKSITHEDYHRLSDSQHIDTKSIKSSSNVDYVAEVFENFILEGPNFGDVYFIPAEYTKDTHDEMQELLFNLGFNCVIKINGTKKEISILTEQESTPLVITFAKISEDLKNTSDENFSPSNNEMSKWLGKHYFCNNGKTKWKMAITGNICVSRGISIQSPECLITHAIYGPKCAKDYTSKYQIFARVCGNIREFPGYKETGGPIVYCSKKDFDETCRMDQYAINLGIESQRDGPNGRVVVDSERMTELYETTDREFRCKTVPIIHHMTDEEYDNLRLPNDRFNREYIIKLLSKSCDELEDYVIQEISEPKKDAPSYKRHITDIVAKAENNTKAIIDFNKKSRSTNYNKKLIWIFVDGVNKKFVVTRWDGSKW